jgi:hypothetical protein
MCGGGKETWKRSCDGPKCVGEPTQIRDCNTQPCNWNNWTVTQAKRTQPDNLLLDDALKNGDGTINVNEAQKKYCPTCDSRTELYQITYRRECNGEECIGKDGRLTPSETVTIHCDHLEPCAWDEWKMAKDCTNECNVPSDKQFVRHCLGDYCDPEPPLNIGSSKTESCPIKECGKSNAVLLNSFKNN